VGGPAGGSEWDPQGSAARAWRGRPAPTSAPGLPAAAARQRRLSLAPPLGPV